MFKKLKCLTTVKNKFNLWLLSCFTFIAAMLFVRYMHTGSIKFTFLIWNIFLAFIPYVISCFFTNTVQLSKWKQMLVFGSWLLFFPNALYIVTDIIHLNDIPNIPVWFDAVLLFSASFVGLALAFVSLINVENFLLHFYTLKLVQRYIALLLFFGAFGVYLGRFKRWNSWDIVTNPVSLFADIVGRFLNPFSHLYSWGIIFFLTILYAVCWYFLKSITKLVKA
jgi:uncharacterized membrane protein